jgi:UDP-GlcNAc:undecaprenyl-phosphate GlcNAc-1-phosphate transferase
MFCLAFTAAVLFAPAVRFLAVRTGAVDRPDGKRKIHTKPMPRLGGVVIGLAILMAAALYYLINRNITESISATPEKIAGFIGGFIVILGVGVWDDFRGVSPLGKLAWQTVAVIICYATGLRVDVPFVANEQVAAVLSFPVTWFWLVACINSMNLVDGMDGLASGVAFFAGLVIFILAAVYSKVAVALAAAAMLGGVAGFLMYNFHPAVMFLGDSGSLLLGYMVAILAIAGSLKSHATLALLVPILALGVPIMDTLLAILRRASRRLPISQADREHIHHKLLEVGFSHREAVFVLYGGCLTLAVGALVLASAGSLAVGVAMGLLCVGAVVVVQTVGVHKLASSLRALGEAIRTNGHERQLAAEKNTVFWLRQSQNYEDIDKALEPYLRAIHATAASVHVDDATRRLITKVELAQREGAAGRVERALTLGSGRGAVLVVEGEAAENLQVAGGVTEALSEALARVDKQGNRDTELEETLGRGLAEGLATR